MKTPKKNMPITTPGTPKLIYISIGAVGMFITVIKFSRPINPKLWKNVHRSLTPKKARHYRRRKRYIARPHLKFHAAPEPLNYHRQLVDMTQPGRDHLTSVSDRQGRLRRRDIDCR